MYVSSSRRQFLVTMTCGDSVCGCSDVTVKYPRQHRSRCRSRSDTNGKHPTACPAGGGGVVHLQTRPARCVFSLKCRD